MVLIVHCISPRNTRSLHCTHPGRTSPRNRYFSQEDSGLLRILEENEWRGIGITQSLGWEHFEVHGESGLIWELSFEHGR